MRMVSYNILDGGTGRADPIAEVIEAQRADVVALIEADDLEVVERIARRLKMDWVRGEGNSHAAAILSKGTIVESINHAPLEAGLSKCFLEAKIAGNRGEVIVGAVHLHAHAREADEDLREKEIELILARLAGYRTGGRAHLLMGDFNANSPVQEIDPAKLKPSSAREFVDNGARLPRRVMTKMLEAGYLDCLAVARNDEARSGATFSTLHAGQRVDYILAYGIEPQRIKDAWIETDRLARYASDHFPVGAEIVWE
jgi:endonuclease/exonuclease/phosphatase family metal-dependent hydrolase